MNTPLPVLSIALICIVFVACSTDPSPGLTGTVERVTVRAGLTPNYKSSISSTFLVQDQSTSGKGDLAVVVTVYALDDRSQREFESHIGQPQNYVALGRLEKVFDPKFAALLTANDIRTVTSSTVSSK